MEYWQKDIETMNREDLKKLQFERLRKTIETAGNSPFYSKVFKENVKRYYRKPNSRIAFGQRLGPMG